jgi:hypothetical protein
MSNTAGLAGGCVCGSVRYRLSSPPFDAGFCHCEICRRSAGAPVLAFATVPQADFIVTAGSPRKRRSSAFGTRWFCADCGTQLAIQVDHQPDTIDFTIASLDTAAEVQPQFHIFFGSKIAWFDCGDHFPRHAAFRPDTRGLAEDESRRIPAPLPTVMS